jgi:hypothetical protein
MITLSPETSKQRAHTKRFFNPECSECSPLSLWTRINVEEASRELFRDPRDARGLVTRLQNQGVPAIMEHHGDSEYYVVSYRQLQAEEEDSCPEGFKEHCIQPGGSKCESYMDGVCTRVQEEA